MFKIAANELISIIGPGMVGTNILFLVPIIGIIDTNIMFFYYWYGWNQHSVLISIIGMVCINFLFKVRTQSIIECHSSYWFLAPKTQYL